MSTEQKQPDTNPKYKEFKSLLEKDFKDRKFEVNKIVQATVVEIIKNYIVVDAKLKSECMIPREEFNEEELSKLKVGDKIPCFLERLESARTGEAVLSYEKSKRMAAWEKAVAAFKKKEILTGYIRKRIKGGFEFELFGGALFAFLPTSQASDAPLKKVDSLLNVPLQVIAVRCDTTRGNLAVSRREVLNLKKNKEIAEDLKQIKEGQKISCTVKNVTSFGAFLSYNNTLDLLLHQSDMSWSRVKSPHDLLSVGDTIDVIVSKIDKETNRCSASIKLLSEDPYKNIFKQFEVGKIYPCTVDKVLEYGAFCNLNDSLQGLLHQSEISWVSKNSHPSKFLSPSMEIFCKIIDINVESRRISLSLRQTTDNPLEQLKDKINQKVRIKIVNKTSKGIFGELDSKLTGFCHWRELDFNESQDNLKKYQIGDQIDVVLTEIKDEKLRFSRRLLDKDPLDWFKENKKKVGDIITTQVFEVMKSGIKVSVDKDKKIIVSVKKIDLAKTAADSRPEIYQKSDSIDCMITSLDLERRIVKLSPKQALLYEEKNLIQKFGANASKSGSTLKSIFDRALGKKDTKKKK